MRWMIVVKSPSYGYGNDFVLFYFVFKTHRFLGDQLPDLNIISAVLYLAKLIGLLGFIYSNSKSEGWDDKLPRFMYALVNFFD